MSLSFSRTAQTKNCEYYVVVIRSEIMQEKCKIIYVVNTIKINRLLVCVRERDNERKKEIKAEISI